MKNNFYVALLVLLSLEAMAQTGNYVSGGSEAVTFGSVDLPTGGGTWATERSATPGYFSMVGSGDFKPSDYLSYIDGYVKTYNQQEFTLPIGGAGKLRFLAAIGASEVDTYAAAWIDGDPTTTPDPTDGVAVTHNVASFTAPIKAVSPVGQWDWLHLEGTTPVIGVLALIPDMTDFAETENLRMVGWNGTSWVDLSGEPSAWGNTENSLMGGYVSEGITALAIGTVELPLPVELISFQASEIDCRVNLKWETTGEINLHHFEVQQSQDALHFTKLDQLRSSQIEGSGHTYTYSTTQPMGTSYYRLKMVDQDNTFDYSSLQSLTTSCEGPEATITVYPNPIIDGSETVQIEYNTSYNGNAQLSILNIAGQEVLFKSLQVDGPGTANLDVSRLQSGLYLIKILNAEGKTIGKSRKIVKQ